MKRVARLFLTGVEDGIGSMLLLATFGVMLSAVLFRYIFNDSLTWSEEFARYALVALTFTGIATGFRKGAHIKIDVLSSVFPTQRRLFDAVGLILSMLFLGFLAWQSIQLSTLLGASRSAAMGMPSSWLYIAVTAALLLGLLRAAIAFAQNLRELPK